MYGEYQHSVDSKGRIFVPAKLREELGDRFYVIPGVERCLLVYTMEKWAPVQEKIDALPLAKRGQLRHLMANIAECTPDKQGRILLPTRLREYAELRQDITFLGQSDHAEIWDTAAYERSVDDQLSPEYLRAAMEALEI